MTEPNKMDDKSNKDTDSEVSSNSEDDGSDGEEALSNIEIKNLKSQVEANPYVYDSHIALITTLRKTGDLDELRLARNAMAKVFPLTEEIWLAWLQDEIKLANSDEEKDKINDLFDKAVEDYLAVGVWLEYVQFSIGFITKDNGITMIRAVFERAVMMVGLHVTRGSSIWDAYREFELAILSGLQPAPGSVSTPQQLADLDAQNKKIAHLFKRQLSVPLLDIQTTWEEYKEWMNGDIDSNVEKIYQKTLEKLTSLLEYENKLEAAESPRKKEYLTYIEYEEKNSDPARIQCLYERMIEENCLDTDMWIKYTEYLDRDLKIGSVVLKVYGRAVRNCSWSVVLWVGYLRALERYKEEHSKIQGIFQEALEIGYQEGSDYLKLWQTYIDYLRRKIDWDKDYETPLFELRDALDKACTSLKQVKGDGENSVLQYYARLEGMYLNNMTSAREIWTEILQHGCANQANVWMEYLRLERSYGNVKHCRKILQRAINSVTDFPEIIVNAYISFERDEGTLESYDNAVQKCKAQIARIEERKAQAAEKESKFEGKSRHQKFSSSKFKQSHVQSKGSSSDSSSKAKVFKRKSFKQPENDSPPKVQVFKRKIEDTNPSEKADITDEDGFKKPTLPNTTRKPVPPPGFVESSSVNGQSKRSSPPPGYVSSSEEPPAKKRGPPPGYKPSGDVSEVKKSTPPPGFVPSTKESTEKNVMPPPGFQPTQSKTDDIEMVDKLLEEEAKADQNEDMPTSSPVQYDMSKYPRTVFISNLSYDVKEDEIRDIFSKIGKVTDIRMVKNYDGKFKGFGYVEFVDELCVGRALDLDRMRISGRPMFVSCCKDNKSDPNKFRFATSMEKNKLFVKNLPAITDEVALKNIFSQHGELKGVRIVTYRSGASKGIAYVEYVNEADATKALMMTDGLQVGDKTISVAISNPPSRGQPKQMNKGFAPPQVQNVSRGPQQQGPRKSKTQVSLVPRAIQRAPPNHTGKPGVSKTKPSETTTKNDTQPSKPASAMTNNDFRAMLLKK